MSTDLLVQIIVIAAAVPATAFLILYPLLSPTWHKSWIGRAMEASSFGLAWLLNQSLIFRWFDVRPPNILYAVILTIIATGAWLMLGALIHIKLRVYRHVRIPAPRVSQED